VPLCNPGTAISAAPTEDHNDAQQRGPRHLLLEKEPLDAEGHHWEGIRQEHRDAGVEPAQALEIAEGLDRPKAHPDEGDASGALPERSAEAQPREADAGKDDDERQQVAPAQ
jgi:hypothetical protein